MQPRKLSIGMASIKSTSTDIVNKTPFEPCAASAELLIFAQGNSIVCLRHDTLELERRYEGHTSKVVIISIDNTTPECPRVVSVDDGKTAIIWDLHSGEEVSRYQAYEDIRVAAWMKNGNLAFGDAMGNVILFDPIRTESISARTIFDPLTSIAPSADCRSFALGYNNGSILVAALSPSFTILHTLTTTSHSPSPVTTLAWHASSSKQKTDMLAVQTRDGHLRIWSVPKSVELDEHARVVRILEREKGTHRGNNWLGWSRNGRVVQYSGRVGTLWDVRTKKVSWEAISAIDNFDVCGICVYGPAGKLFTLSTDHSVQQYSLQTQELVANVQHLPGAPPPSPPVSLEEKPATPELNSFQNETLHSEAEGDSSQNEQPAQATAPAETRRMKPLERIAQELERLERMKQPENGYGTSPPDNDRPASVSSRGSRTSTGSDGSRGTTRHVKKLSVSSKEEPADRHLKKLSISSKATNESDQSLSPRASPVSAAPRRPSLPAAPQPSPRKLHPLRQEMHMSPDMTTPQSAHPLLEVREVFPNLKERIVNLTYDSPRAGPADMDPDDHRKEMLCALFGWKGDIEGLVSDELESVNARSLTAIVLRLWLGDLDQSSLAVMLGADFTVSGDWLLIALSAMCGQDSWTHVARALVPKLVQKNDIHMAVLALLAVGDKNDAVELYTSHKFFMEAVLLTTLLWQRDWNRISDLVRQWGQHALEIHETGLAARCFACAGTEIPPEKPTAPPASSSSAVNRSASVQRSNSHMRSRSENEAKKGALSISAPSNPRSTLRMTPKDSPLKLITDFPASPQSPQEPVQRSATTSPTIGGVNRFFNPVGLRSAHATPIMLSAALTPRDPFWQEQPFQRENRSHTPAQKDKLSGQNKLPAVTESSPAEPTPPIKRLPSVLGNREMKISSPIEPRTSSGFAETMPVNFGEQTRTTTPKPSAFSKFRRPSFNLGGRRPSDVAMEIKRPSTDSHGYRRPSLPTGSDIPPPLAPPPNGALPTPPNSGGAPPGMVRSQTPRMAPAPPPMPTPPMQWSNTSIDSVLRQATPQLAPAPPPPRPPRPEVAAAHSRKGSLGSSPPVSSSQFPLRREIDSIDDFMDIMTKSHKRLDSQRAVITPRGSKGSARQESPPRIRRPESPPHLRVRRISPDGRPRGRAPRPMELNLGSTRGRVAEIKGSHVRSPSSPLPFTAEASLYRDDPPPAPEEDEPEPLTGRYYGDEGESDGRGREMVRDFNYLRSPSSPPAYGMPEQARHYQYDDDDQIAEGGDEYDDERYYTTVNQFAAPRGRARELGLGSLMRSPSSPVPGTTQAQFYRQMAADMELEHKLAAPTPLRKPTLQPRMRSASSRLASANGLRRSRSERVMKQWSKQLEQEGKREMKLERSLTTRGLPSNPKSWKTELMGGSRTASPLGEGRARSRGRSPGLGSEAPMRSFTPSGKRSPRTISPAPIIRPFSPPRKVTGDRSRSSSRQGTNRILGDSKKLDARIFGRHMGSPGPDSKPSKPQKSAKPPKGALNISAPLETNPGAFHVPCVPDYESIYSPVEPKLPDFPSIPGTLDRQHQRNKSEPTFEPLVRKLGRQDPPHSPPPLPYDMPVRPALQTHLDSNLLGKKRLDGTVPRSRTIRRVKRTDELTSPVDPNDPYGETNELSIVVGMEAGDAMPWRGEGGGWGYEQRGRGGHRHAGSTGSMEMGGML